MMVGHTAEPGIGRRHHEEVHRNITQHLYSGIACFPNKGETLGITALAVRSFWNNLEQLHYVIAQDPVIIGSDYVP